MNLKLQIKTLYAGPYKGSLRVRAQMKLHSLHDKFISGKMGSLLQDPKIVCASENLVCFAIVLDDILHHLPAMCLFTLKDKRITI